MSKTKETKEKPMIVALSAVDPYIATNIVEPTEKEVHGYDFIEWGAGNKYPDYVLDLYKNVPVLQSLINGSVDYTCGDDCSLSNEPFSTKVNDKDETIETLLKKIVYDWWIYGAFAINIVRNIKGGVACLYYVSVRNLRQDKKCERFWYAEDWAKSYGRVKAIEYPKYDINGTEPSSILYVKNTWNSTYGIPVYAAATKSAEVSKSIDIYELNSVNNGFMASHIINFNNGQPSPEVAQEIEDELNEKFSGVENASRLMVAFNKSKDNEVTVQKLEQPDFHDKFESLCKWTNQQLFTAFRAAPMLFGIYQESSGFNDQDYQQAFKLFNRTCILPVQRLICNAFKAIFGEDVLTIKPFTIDFSEDGTEPTQVK